MITISIVDDDAGVRESIRRFVNAARGLRCIGAYENTDEALKCIPNDKPDVVLMDINMPSMDVNLPSMDGIECAYQLKLALPSMNILMLTVFEDNEKIFKALACGANGYLLKRSPPAKLLEAIREVYEGGSPMSAPIARKVVRSFQHVGPAGVTMEPLSLREKQVLDCLARGYVYKQIRDELGLSIDTIRTYIRRIYEKLHVHSKTEAVAKYMRF